MKGYKNQSDYAIKQTKILKWAVVHYVATKPNFQEKIQKQVNEFLAISEKADEFQI